MITGVLLWRRGKVEQTLVTDAWVCSRKAMPVMLVKGKGDRAHILLVLQLSDVMFVEVVERHEHTRCALKRRRQALDDRRSRSCARRW